jgi:hypothetical protein
VATDTLSACTPAPCHAEAKQRSESVGRFLTRPTPIDCASTPHFSFLSPLSSLLHFGVFSRFDAFVGCRFIRHREQFRRKWRVFRVSLRSISKHRVHHREVPPENGFLAPQKIPGSVINTPRRSGDFRFCEFLRTKTTPPSITVKLRAGLGWRDWSQQVRIDAQ